MCDCAIFLCCLNNMGILCLEYTCLILSILIFPINLLGILKINWNLIRLYCEIIYSINITIFVFSTFLNGLVIYSTKTRKITSHELHKSFLSITLMIIFIYAYLIITYSLCSFQIIKDYLNINKIDHLFYSNKEKEKIKEILKLKTTWIKIYLFTFLPIILSIINMLIWISIYYRISFKIYCSFNKEIRKVLREQRKKNKQFQKFDENINSIDEDINNKNKDKNQKDINNFVFVVVEKDRQNPYRVTFNNNSGNRIKNFNNEENNKNMKNKNINKNKIYKNMKTNDKELNQSDIISSERKFEKSNNKIN